MSDIDLLGIQCSSSRERESVPCLPEDVFDDPSGTGGRYTGRGRHVPRWTMPGGARITIRPIHPEDEPMMVDFHRTLSDRTVYLRYFSTLATKFRTTHDRLSRICSSSSDGETVLVAERADPSIGTIQIIGVGRLNKLQSGKEGEIAILVTDAFQGKGLESELLANIVAVAQADGISRLFAYILRENLAMKSLAQKHQFKFPDSVSSPVTEAVLDLK